MNLKILGALGSAHCGSALGDADAIAAPWVEPAEVAFTIAPEPDAGVEQAARVNAVAMAKMGTVLFMTTSTDSVSTRAAPRQMA
jgi:SH3-like domain-containing protein